MRILVTGGAGFIGSHLCTRLVKEGHYVICLDNLFSGSKENIIHLQKYPNFEFIRHDITQPILLEVDMIFNLACPASPIHYQYNPVKTIKTNVLGMLNMLGLAKRVKARILQASTSEVYGDPAVHPQREDYWGNVNPIGVRACYDEGKRCAEALCFSYKMQNNVDIRVARIFNTYGPNMLPNDGRVISNFIVQALKDEPITVYGKGEQTRSFCYIDDLVEGLVRYMFTEKVKDNKETDLSGPVNLGNPAEFKIIEIAKLVIKLTHSKSKIIFKEIPPDDPQRRCPDISLAKRLFGYNPKTDLEDGLKKTIKYFRSVLRKGL